MGIEVVEHDTDDRDVRIGLDDVLHAVRKVDPGATLHQPHIAPATLGLADHHQLPNAMAPILGVLAGGRARLCWNGLADLADQLFRALVEAHHRACRIIRLGIQIQHLFHRCNKLRADLGNAPLLHLPGFQCVFLTAGARSHG